MIAGMIPQFEKTDQNLIDFKLLIDVRFEQWKRYETF